MGKNNMDSAFLNYCRQKIREYPTLRADIMDIYFYVVAEIEDGGSIEHEIELGYNSIAELIEDRGL